MSENEKTEPIIDESVNSETSTTATESQPKKKRTKTPKEEKELIKEKDMKSGLSSLVSSPPPISPPINPIVIPITTPVITNAIIDPTKKGQTVENVKLEPSTSKLSSFKVIQKDGKFIKALFEAIQSVLGETKFHIDKEGISISGMDGSHICLVDVFLAKEDFEEYIINGNEVLEPILSLEDFTKIIKRNEKNDPVTLYSTGLDKKIYVELTPDGKKKSRKFSLSMLSVDAEQINMDSLHNMSFNNKVKINSSDIEESIKDAEIFSNCLEVLTIDDTLHFKTEGSIGDFESVFEIRELLDDTKFTENCSNSFSIDFLKSILKISPLQKIFKIDIGEGQPLHFKMDLLKKSRIEYFLAPRVEENTGNNDPNDQ